MIRILTKGQFVARAALRSLGWIVLFGAITFVAATVFVSWLLP